MRFLSPCSYLTASLSYFCAFITLRNRSDRLITGGQPSGTYWIWDWFPYRPSLVDHEMCSSTTPGCPFQMNGTIYTYQWVMNTGSIVVSRLNEFI